LTAVEEHTMPDIITLNQRQNIFKFLKFLKIQDLVYHRNLLLYLSAEVCGLKNYPPLNTLDVIT